MKDYDVSEAFREIELDLIKSMKRNLSKHQQWEKDEGINWTMWQAEQLKTLEGFKKSNKKVFGKRFNGINAHIEDMLRSNYETVGFDQEREILEAIQQGYKPFNIPQGVQDFLGRIKGRSIMDVLLKRNMDTDISGSFFHLNEAKMNALVKSTTKDMSKAEHAILRMSDDQYRKTIFKAQVMANSGAETLQKSIDMATHDFLSAGINCIEYKNGRRVNIATYAEMAVRTANKRAVLVSEGEARKVYGIHTVKVSTYGQCSPTCLPFQGKTFIDDVFSGGAKEEAEKLNLPLLSWAIDQGLFHPNCKHRLITAFPELENNDDGDPRDKSKIIEYENPPEEQEHRKNQLRIQQQKRFETGSLDQHNIDTAKQRKSIWQRKDNLLLSSGGEDTFSKSKIVGIKDIDYFDEVERLELFDGFRKEYINAKEEYALVWSKNNTATIIKGQSSMVDITLVDRLEDAYVIHNHPPNKTHYSFSGNDVQLFLGGRIKKLEGLDNQYHYTITRKGDTIYEGSENIIDDFGNKYRIRAIENNLFEALEDDEYHKIVEALSKDFNFEYERKKIK